MAANPIVHSRNPLPPLAVPALLLALLLTLAGCAPRATGSATSPQAQQLERTAEIAFHRMQIGRLESGEYTTNVLVDLALPKGVKWVLEGFSTDSFSLLFTDDGLPGTAWRVTPVGVQQVVVPTS